MLSNLSKVILRNEELLAQGKWLIANAADAHVFTQLDNQSIFGFHQFHDIYTQACKLDNPAKHTFTADYQDKDFDGAVVIMPKAKEHLKMLLANVVACLKKGATIVLVGENKSGIKSASKFLTPYASVVNKLDSAKHCAAWVGEIDQSIPPFNIEDWQAQHAVNANGLSFKVCSLPGVFSHGELDAGTLLLLENTGRVPSGALLDFACGCGVIGCYLALKNDKASVTMSDVSALAIYCSEQSIKLNAVQAKIVPSNGLAQVKGKFTGIYTNPPFHTGIKTDYSIVTDFIRQIPKNLQDSGKLVLVANRFLKYQDGLEQTFKRNDIVAQTSKFNLFQSALK